MSESDLFFLPADVREGLAKARARDRRATGGRLRVQMGDVWFPITSFDDAGFGFRWMRSTGCPGCGGWSKSMMVRA